MPRVSVKLATLIPTWLTGPRAGTVLLVTVLAPLYVGACAYIRSNRPPAVATETTPAELARARYEVSATQPWRSGRPPRRAVAPVGRGRLFEGEVSPRPTARLETTALNLRHQDIADAAKVDYWEQRVLSRWALVLVGDVSRRFEVAPEERAAVLSVAERVLDAGTAAATLAVRAPGGSWARVYRLQRREAGAGETRPVVELTFVGELDRAEPIDLPDLASTETVAVPDVTFDRFWLSPFPDNGQWTEFVGQKGAAFRELLQYIGRLPPGSFTTAFRTRDRSGVPHTLIATGVKGTEPRVNGLTIDYVGEGDLQFFDPPEGYATRGFGDLQLERGGRDTLTDAPTFRINRISGLPGGDPKLAQWLKFCIAAYADKMTIDSQVNLAVPTTAEGRTLFSFRYQRSGDPGATPPVWDVIVEGPLGPAGTCDPHASRETIARFMVEQLPKDPAVLRENWNRRHPANKLSDESELSVLQQRIVQMLEKELSGKWFVENYGVFTLDQSIARDWLTNIDSSLLHPQQRDLVKDWDYFDYLMLEMALGQFSEPIRVRLREIRLIRSGDLPPDERGDRRTSQASGLTLHSAQGSNVLNTIFIYDLTYRSSEHLFERGDGAVYPHVLRTYIHELGHVVAFSNAKAPMERFNARFAATDAKKMTWYAEAYPDREFFPEAFAAYYLDGPWLRESYPDIYEFLRTLAETGTAP